MYCDLLFSSANDEHLEFIQWIENLESKIDYIESQINDIQSTVDDIDYKVD